MKPSICISGWYGIPNTGAEAILKVIIKFLKTNGIDDITVFSWDPEYIKKNYDVNSVSHFSVYDMFRIIKNSNIFIFGGGDLILGSNFAPFFWLSKPMISKILRKKTIALCIGTRPLKNNMQKIFVRNVMNKFDLIITRDNSSAELLKGIGIKNILTSADPAFILDTDKNDAKKAEKIMKQHNLNSNNTIGICIRPWYRIRKKWCLVKFYNPKKLLISLNRVLWNLTELGYDVLFIPMQMRLKANDLIVVKRLFEMNPKLKERVRYIERLYPPETTKCIIGNTKIMISMRYHPLIFSISSSIPSIGISYQFSTRISNLMKESGLEKYLIELNSISDKNLLSKILAISTENKKLKQKMEKFRNKNIKLVNSSFNLVKKKLGI